MNDVGYDIADMCRCRLGSVAGSPPAALQVDDESVGQRAADAQHHDLVRLAFFIAEHFIAMFDLSLQHADLARSALPLPAGVRMVRHDFADDVEGAAVSRHDQDQMPTPQLDL